MRRAIAAVAVAVVALVAMTGCEPKMTITAGIPSYVDEYLECQRADVDGQVTPIDATKKVVLQWTKGGKWVDYSSWVDATRPSARVYSNGKYDLQFYVGWQGTRHLRIRSEGGSAFSPGFYMTVEGSDGC